MSFLLQAPYPQVAVSSFMPNPQFNDSRGLPIVVKPRYMIDGTRFTYVQTNNDYNLHFPFLLTRAKAEELKQFVFAFFAKKILIRTHLNETFVGYIMNNPFEEISAKVSQGIARELVSVTLVFRGQLVTGVTLSCT